MTEHFLMHSQSIILFLEIGSTAAFFDESVSVGLDESKTFQRCRPSDDLRVLTQLLDPYLSELEIVITDPSALHAPLDLFRAEIPSDIAARVTDSVYLSELTDSCWSDYHSSIASRYACIELWLARRRPEAINSWLALDRRSPRDSWPIMAQDNLVLGSLLDEGARRRFSKILKEKHGGLNKRTPRP
jgi:hypothetical protein